MANLQSNTERWLTLKPEDLITSAKDNKHFRLALTTVDAVTPSLMKMAEGYLSESGDIEVFLYVALDESSKRVLASIVLPTEDEKGFQPRSTCYDEQARDLIASFLCDFPNSLFSVEGGLPLVLFMQEQRLKRFVTLNNMIEAGQLGTKRVVVAVPGGQSKSKSKMASCATSDQIMNQTHN
jgi:hypothetical protein